MESKYFITAFGDIEQIQMGNDIARDLQRVGNILPSYEGAFGTLGKIRMALSNAKSIQELHDKG